jgi:hypothetical protein
MFTGPAQTYSFYVHSTKISMVETRLTFSSFFLLSESQAEMDGVLRRSGLPDGKF